MIDIQNVSLLDILPPNLRRDPTISAAAKSIDEELRQITVEISTLSLFDRLDELTDSEANELAYQFHVDFYDPSLPIEKKRELVKKSIPFHRRKGTPSAVEELISIIFGEGRVEEWFEYGGKPFHFRVLTNNPEVTQDKAIEFYRAVESVKRLSAHLERVILYQAEEMSLYMGCALHVGEKMTVRQVN